MSATGGGNRAGGRGSLLIVFLTVLIDLVGFGIFIPLLPAYGRMFGGSTLVAGALVGAYSAVQLFFQPILGRLSDRIGRRPVLLLGLAGSCVAYSIFGIGTERGELGWMFAARILAGMFGATIATAQAYVADVTKPETRAKGMGLIGAAFGLGFTLGPPIGGVLSERVSLAAPAYFASALSASAFLLGAFLLPESRRPGAESHRTFSLAAARDALGDPRRGPLLLMFLLQTWAFANLEAMFPLLGQDLLGLDREHMGYVFFFVGIVVAAVQGGLIHRAVRALGERGLFARSTLALAAGFFVVGHARHVALFLLACAVIGVAYGFSSPTINALLSRNTPVDRQGGTFGVAQSCAGLGRAVGHLSAGAAFALAPWAPFTAAAVGLVFVFLLFRRFARRFPRDLSDEALEAAA